MLEIHKIHVLPFAYQCVAGMGLVSQFGWEWYRRLCLSCQGKLLTHARNYSIMDAAIVRLKNSRVTYNELNILQVFSQQGLVNLLLIEQSN